MVSPIYLYITKHSLRSSGTGLLSVARMKTKEVEAAFGFFYLWKKLPEYITVSLRHDCLLCNYLSWFCFYRLLNAILIFS